MIKRVFVDSDVILDVAMARRPFVEASKAELSLLDNGRAAGFTSSNSITNVYRRDCIVTRNVGDYKLSCIDVYSPVEFLNSFE